MRKNKRIVSILKNVIWIALFLIYVYVIVIGILYMRTGTVIWNIFEMPRYSILILIAVFIVSFPVLLKANRK